MLPDSRCVIPDRSENSAVCFLLVRPDPDRIRPMPSASGLHYVHLNLMFCSEKSCPSKIDSNLMKSAVLRGRKMPVLFYRIKSRSQWLDWKRTEMSNNRTNNNTIRRNAHWTLISRIQHSDDELNLHSDDSVSRSFRTQSDSRTPKQKWASHVYGCFFIRPLLFLWTFRKKRDFFHLAFDAS